jgi:hypothetical protein
MQQFAVLPVMCVCNCETFSAARAGAIRRIANKISDHTLPVF